MNHLWKLKNKVLVPGTDLAGEASPQGTLSAAVWGHCPRFCRSSGVLRHRAGTECSQKPGTGYRATLFKTLNTEKPKCGRRDYNFIKCQLCILEPYTAVQIHKTNLQMLIHRAIFQICSPCLSMGADQEEQIDACPMEPEAGPGAGPIHPG